MPELVVRLRDREMSRVEMTHTRVTIGRDASCDVVIDNAGVSRTHAILVYMDNAFKVRDASSQNGITLNGHRVDEAEIDYGDRIGIGKFEVELVEDGVDAWELQAGSGERMAAPKNVMSTVQMDAGAAARLRDEILRKKAATHGGDQPAARTKRKRKEPPENAHSAAAPQSAMTAQAGERLVPPHALKAAGAVYPSRSSSVPGFVWVLLLVGLFGLAALLIVRLT